MFINSAESIINNYSYHFDLRSTTNNQVFEKKVLWWNN